MDDTEKEWIEMKKWVAVLLLFSLLASVGISYADKEEKALILYFDYSENIDTTGLDADAVSQASMAGTRARDTSNLLVMVDVLFTCLANSMGDKVAPLIERNTMIANRRRK